MSSLTVNRLYRLLRVVVFKEEVLSRLDGAAKSRNLRVVVCV